MRYWHGWMAFARGAVQGGCMACTEAAYRSGVAADVAHGRGVRMNL
ncbi:hypothetical protein [Comamonas sp. lk]|nr:hypothetical protein [Comamonas sp. lk]